MNCPQSIIPYFIHFSSSAPRATPPCPSLPTPLTWHFIYLFIPLLWTFHLFIFYRQDELLQTHCIYTSYKAIKWLTIKDNLGRRDEADRHLYIPQCTNHGRGKRKGSRERKERLLIFLPSVVSIGTYLGRWHVIYLHTKRSPKFDAF